MTNKKYMTVVFEYEDGAVFPLELTEAFSRKDRKIADKTYVSSVGLNQDSYSNADHLMEYLEHYDRWDWDGDEIARILNGEEVKLI